MSKHGSRKRRQFAEETHANRAALDIGAEEIAKDCTGFECCKEELVFAMRDNYHAFSIGLLTILDCLKMAEQGGYVPKLPEGWWRELRQE
jgi:hypothetical protein